MSVHDQLDDDLHHVLDDLGDTPNQVARALAAFAPRANYRIDGNPVVRFLESWSPGSFIVAVDGTSWEVAGAMVGISTPHAVSGFVQGWEDGDYDDLRCPQTAVA